MKNKLKYILSIIFNLRNMIIFLAQKRIIKIGDEKYLRMLYKKKTGKRLNLDEPVTFNEKLQWLKINNRKDIYTKMVDKYEAKDFIAKYVDKKYIVPTLGVYDKFDDIDFDSLPNKFVIKCTHDSGGLTICKDKNKLNIKSTKKIINKCLKRNFYYLGREWPYKNVKPRIIIEPLLENNDGSDLKEYNVFCFNGVPNCLMVCYGDRNIKRYNDFYDVNFKKMNVKCNYESSDKVLPKPKNFDKILEISKILSKGIPFLRVDFFVVNDEIKLGELTFFHWSGFGKFKPEEYDYKFGQLINIRNKRKEK